MSSAFSSTSSAHCDAQSYAAVAGHQRTAPPQQRRPTQPLAHLPHTAHSVIATVPPASSSSSPFHPFASSHHPPHPQPPPQLPSHSSHLSHSSTLPSAPLPSSSSSSPSAPAARQLHGRLAPSSAPRIAATPLSSAAPTLTASAAAATPISTASSQPSLSFTLSSSPASCSALAVDKKRPIAHPSAASSPPSGRCSSSGAAKRVEKEIRATTRRQSSNRYGGDEDDDAQLAALPALTTHQRAAQPTARSTRTEAREEKEAEEAEGEGGRVAALAVEADSVDFSGAFPRPLRPVHPVHSALHVPHLWSEIVQQEVKPHVPAAGTGAGSSSSASSVSAISTSSSASSSSSARVRGRSACAFVGGRAGRVVERSPLSAAYFASLVPVDKEHQKHLDRAARHQHDVRFHRDAVISVLACILEQLFPLRDSDVLPLDPALITMFHTERVPSITISSYLGRLAQYTECSSEVLIQSIIHINRILHHRPSFHINSLNIHRLLLTSLLCSAKFFDDQYYNNAYYAKVGGISVRELNDLEIEFLALINFDLFVDFSVYAAFYAELGGEKLHQHCACNYKDMPHIDTSLYHMPPEYHYNQQHQQEEEETKDGAEDVEGVDEDADERLLSSRSRVSDVNEQLHSTPQRPSSAVPASLSPSTTASSSSASSDDDDAAAAESEEEEGEEAEGEAAECAEQGDDKVMSINSPQGLGGRQSSAASTVSVSRSMDNLVMEAQQLPQRQPMQQPSPTSSIPSAAAAEVASGALFAPPSAFPGPSESMSDSPPLTSKPSGLSSSLVIHRVVAAAALPPRLPDYYFMPTPHYVHLDYSHLYPPPPPPPHHAFVQQQQPHQQQHHQHQHQHQYQHAYPNPFYPPPPPPPQLSQFVVGRVGAGPSPSSQHPHPSRHPHHSQPPSLHHTPILLGSVM